MPVTFDTLQIARQYDRPTLAKLWGYSSFEALSRGIITPAGTRFIILFITHEKQEFLTQYADTFSDGILKMEGEKGRRTDRRLVAAEERGDEIHLFYRDRHHMPFTYEGRVMLADYVLSTDQPSSFTFATSTSLAAAASALVTEAQTHGIIDPEFIPDEEGRTRIARHVRYERSRKNRERALELHGTTCKACGFDFNVFYGPELAREFIEVHHVESVTQQAGKPLDPAKDLVPVCSNCHSMLHRKRGVILRVEDLRAIIAGAKVAPPVERAQMQ